MQVSFGARAVYFFKKSQIEIGLIWRDSSVEIGLFWRKSPVKIDPFWRKCPKHLNFDAIYI